MMTTELDKVMAWYEVSLECQTIMHKLINKRPEIIPLESTLATKELKETLDLLTKSIEELNDLAIVSLVSIFEQTLLTHIRTFIQKQMRPTNQMTNKLTDYVVQQTERGKFTEIMDLFKSVVDPQVIGMVKQVYTYRNWVAHGKKTMKTPPKIDPILAYERLSEFLVQITFDAKNSDKAIT